MKVFFSLLISLTTLTTNAQNEIDPSIEVCVAGKCQSGELTRRDILRTTGVLLIDSEKNKLEAFGFQMVFTLKGQEMSYYNNGYNFTNECKEYIGRLMPNDSFKVRLITYKLPDGVVGHAEERSYQIIE